MNIFNSLGSNYNLSFVFKTLTIQNSADYTRKLNNFLLKKYNGQQILFFYKGRQAIETALKIANLPKDSFIAINGFTCFAVYKAIKNCNLNIEYLDISEDDLNFSAKILNEALEKNKKIKAVIIQNTLGYPSDITGIEKICMENNLILIEDLAHSIGTKYMDGREAGTIGDFTTMSFSQDKIIDAISGGALIIRNKKYKNNNDFTFYKLDEKQQFIDRLYPSLTFKIKLLYPVKLGKLLHWTFKKLNLLSQPMSYLDNHLIGLPSWYHGLIIKQFESSEKNLHHKKSIAQIYSKHLNLKVINKYVFDNVLLSTNLRFPIFVNNREKLINYLKNYGIYVSDIWYDSPIAPKKYQDETDYAKQCKNSETISRQILNLPTHLNVSPKQALRIIERINIWLDIQ